MSKLPVGGLRWLSRKEMSRFNIETVDLNGDTGYILECDLLYPENLHKSHSNLPLAPELLEVGYKDLSPYSKKALLATEGHKNYKDVKLISSLLNKDKYILHGKNLKLYLQLGMKLKKIHRIVEFKQEAFIAKFIEMCTLARQKSKSKFEGDQFKKLANRYIL